MKVYELWQLRELFWRFDRQHQGVLVKLAETGQIPPASPDMLTACSEFLRRVKDTTTDSELKADCTRLQGLITEKIGTPFGAM